jgi:hypothetical protein
VLETFYERPHSLHFIKKRWIPDAVVAGPGANLR